MISNRCRTSSIIRMIQPQHQQCPRQFYRVLLLLSVVIHLQQAEVRTSSLSVVIYPLQGVAASCCCCAFAPDKGSCELTFVSWATPSCLIQYFYRAPHWGGHIFVFWKKYFKDVSREFNKFRSIFIFASCVVRTCDKLDGWDFIGRGPIFCPL